MLRYLHKHGNDPDFPFRGAILGAPMFCINTYGLPRGVFRRIAAVAVSIGLADMPLPSVSKLIQDFTEAVMRGRKPPTDALRDEIHEAYKRQTEHFELGFPTLGWVREAARSSSVVMDTDFLRAIRTPIMVLSPDQDSLVSVSAKREAVRHLPDARLVTIAGAKHGVWYDRDEVQGAMWREIDRFMDIVLHPFGWRHPVAKPGADRPGHAAGPREIRLQPA